MDNEKFRTTARTDCTKRLILEEHEYGAFDIFKFRRLMNPVISEPRLRNDIQYQRYALHVENTLTVIYSDFLDYVLIIDGAIDM